MNLCGRIPLAFKFIVLFLSIYLFVFCLFIRLLEIRSLLLFTQLEKKMFWNAFLPFGPSTHILLDSWDRRAFLYSRFFIFCKRSLFNQGSRKVMSWRFPNMITCPGSWIDCKEAVHLGFYLSWGGGILAATCFDIKWWIKLCPLKR